MRLPLSTALLALLASAASLALPSSADSEIDAAPFRPNFPNRVLLIRHGEKPRDGGVGLSRAGLKRAQCVRKVSRSLSGSVLSPWFVSLVAGLCVLEGG